MPAPRFAPTAAAWSARPSDPHDVFVAQLVALGEPAPDAPQGGVGLFGVPYDGAVIGRPGTRGGPEAIRAEMARLKPWTLSSGARTISLRDWGDVRVPYGDVATVHEAVEGAALAVLDAGQFPLALGGDHSITFPLVKAHEGRRQRMGVINLDAHLDVRDVVDGRLNSGQAFGRLLDLGLVQGENLVEVGIRDFANSAAYAEKATKAGATILSAVDWHENGVGVIEHAIALASDGTDGVYLSVDMDVLDQSHAPGVSAPTPGGVSTNELFGAIRLIAKRAKLVGADFVEVAPALDRDGMTARAAAYAAMHLVARVK